MKPTLFLVGTLLAFTGLAARAGDTKDKLLHATLVEELGGER